MTTPNMNLTLPVVSTTPGPAWANQINADLATIDEHNHTFGKGASIPTAALNIDADLPFNGYNATLLNTSQYIDQAGVLPTGFVGGIFVSGTDLWFRDGAGNYIQITSFGSVNAGAGSIGGLPSGTASVSFSPLTGTYTFLQATGSAGALDVGPITLRRTTAGANGVTLIPALGSTAWTLTLPSAPPAAQSVLSVSSGGVVTNATPDGTITVTGSQIRVATLGIQTANIANGAVGTSQIANGAVEYNKRSPLYIQSSGEVLAFIYNTPATTVTVTDNLGADVKVTMLVTASAVRPIWVGLVPLPTNASASTVPSRLLGLDAEVFVDCNGTSALAHTQLPVVTTTTIPIPSASVQTIYVPPSSGTYDFTLKLKLLANVSANATLNRFKLVAYML